MQSTAARQNIFLKSNLSLKNNLFIKRYFADKYRQEPGFYRERTARYFLKIKKKNGAGITIFVNWVRQDLRNTGA